MTLYELSNEYMKQYEHINARIHQLAPQRKNLTGNALLQFDRKMAILNDMANECRMTAYALKNYYEEE